MRCHRASASISLLFSNFMRISASVTFDIFAYHVFIFHDLSAAFDLVKAPLVSANECTNSDRMVLDHASNYGRMGFYL